MKRAFSSGSPACAAIKASEDVKAIRKAAPDSTAGASYSYSAAIGDRTRPTVRLKSIYSKIHDEHGQKLVKVHENPVKTAFFLHVSTSNSHLSVIEVEVVRDHAVDVAPKDEEAILI